MHAGIITVLASSAEQLTIDNINILLPTIQQVTTISGTFRIHIAIANYWLYSYIYIVMRCIGYAGAAVLLCMVAIYSYRLYFMLWYWLYHQVLATTCSEVLNEFPAIPRQ